MTAVIVPNIVKQKIDALLDELQKRNPHAEIFRESLYQDFLNYYNENGYVPKASEVEFELKEGGK